MQLSFQRHLATNYKSPTQIIRVLSENWVKTNIFCPNCSTIISQFGNNNPAADFHCPECTEIFELKSGKKMPTAKIVDGAYKTMAECVKANKNPNLFFLNYSVSDYSVKNFFIIPKHFFSLDMIEKRPPLAPTARRAGFVGCNILLNSIPKSGRIHYISEGKVFSPEFIRAAWKKTLFLQTETPISSRGWTLDVMNCIEKLNKSDFSLNEIYSFERALSKRHPDNKHIKDKIRQQLQILRDKGYLEFVSKGYYRLSKIRI